MGLDFSPAMLEMAKTKARAKNLDIQWVQEDCRRFSLSRKFRLIFMACNSLQHLHQNSQVLSFFDCVQEHLEPGGIFAFDIFRPDLKILNRNSKDKHHVLKFVSDAGIEMSLEESNVYDEISQINSIKWYYSDASGSLIKEDTLEMRQFFPLEIEQLIADSGFKITEKFGAWDRSPMSTVNFKQIFVCEWLDQNWSDPSSSIPNG